LQTTWWFSRATFESAIAAMALADSGIVATFDVLAQAAVLA